MTTLFGPILAVALMAQIQGGTLEGKVVDEAGKPVVDAQVVFLAPRSLDGDVNPVEVQTHADSGGQFRVTFSPLQRDHILRSNIWAYRPGSAFAAAPGYRMATTLGLRKAEPRTIKIEAPDGQPVAGARVAPRAIFFGANRRTAEIPDSLALPRSVTTGRDGKATLDYLAAGDFLAAVRIGADPVGTQDLQLWDSRRAVGQRSEITVRFKPASRLSGRIRSRTGEPVAGQTVEVWLKGGSWLAANSIEFKGEPIRTAGDGSFRTPDNLLVGSSYRVVVRAPGMETILSDWITIEPRPRVLLPMIQRPLRTISGRIVDRQGKPLANIEVFQSGDGPERSAIKTDRDGRFALGGFRQGPVFVFARGDGFRFFGRLVKPGEADLTIELTRTSERPARAMHMLPEPNPLEESRALAGRLLEPYWKGFADKDPAAKAVVLRSLLRADPLGVLGKLDDLDPADARGKATIHAGVSRALAPIDPAQAEVVAEGRASPSARAMALLPLVDALPDSQRDRKLALLDRVAAQAKTVPGATVRLYLVAEVGDRWYALGEKAKARALLGGERGLVNQIPAKDNPGRGIFAAQLAHFDLPSALAIASALPTTGTYTANGALRLIAFHLAADNPAEAERVLRRVPQEAGREWVAPMMALRMAAADPARARKLADESKRSFNHPQVYLFLANGSKTRDPAAAREAFEIAMQGIDQLMTESSPMLDLHEVLLPLVEQVDPTLVPEYFWRVVAARPPIGNPRLINEASSALLTALLGWYDREVAAAVFEPVRAWMERVDDNELAKSALAFQAWAIFDPRAAAARLEQVAVAPQRESDGNDARTEVAEMMQLPHAARWRKIWEDFTKMRQLTYPPLWSPNP
jgi:Carboxypeptidase regulatory-like domain